jgi:hypothetical protein
VFVSAGRFQDFLIVSWLISLGYGGYLLLRTRKGRTLAFTTVGVVAAASIMSARGTPWFPLTYAILLYVGASNHEQDIRAAVQNIMNASITRENFEAIRADLMGSQQLQQLREALSLSSPSRTPPRDPASG